MDTADNHIYSPPAGMPETAEVSMLIGTFDRNIDSKSRIGLPKQHQDKLKGHQLIMLRWMDRSIAIFPLCNWLPYAQRIASMQIYDQDDMVVRRQMFAFAHEINMDKEGRIVIPTDMAKYGRLSGKVMLMGDWDKLTLCNEVYFEDHVEKDSATLSDVFPRMWELAKGNKVNQDKTEIVEEAKTGTEE